MKSKDLSNATSQDLACIFGQRSRSIPSTPQLSDVSANKLCSHPLISSGKIGIIYLVRWQNVLKYFLPLDTHIYVYVSGGKKKFFFENLACVLNE